MENNPYILESIRNTYQYVFLDEFQDTTVLQYELLNLCFGKTSNIITAVGDDRQKIMGWAGAHPDAFSIFEQEFSANTHQLFLNRRSDLKIQKLLQEVNNYAQGEQLGQDGYISSEIKSDALLQVRTFDNDHDETENIVESIQILCGEGVAVEDICILVKQLPDHYVEQLSPILNQIGINTRNEAYFQDLLKENIVQLILNTIMSAIDKRNSHSWVSVLQLKRSFSKQNIFFEPKVEEKFVEETKSFLLFLGKKLGKVDDFEGLFDTFKDILIFYGMDNIRAQFNEYTNLSYLELLIESLCDSLFSYYEKYESWKEAILYLNGKNCVPVMTIHKSKGLEFHTVFLLG